LTPFIRRISTSASPSVTGLIQQFIEIRRALPDHTRKARTTQPLAESENARVFNSRRPTNVSGTRDIAHA